MLEPGTGGEHFWLCCQFSSRRHERLSVAVYSAGSLVLIILPPGLATTDKNNCQLSTVNCNVNYQKGGPAGQMGNGLQKAIF